MASSPTSSPTDGVRLPNEGVVWYKGDKDKRYRKKLVSHDVTKNLITLQSLSLTSRMTSSGIKFDPREVLCQVLPAEIAVEKKDVAGMVIEENYFRIVLPAAKPGGQQTEMSLRGRTEEDRDRWITYFTSLRARGQTEAETYPHGKPPPTPSHLPALRRHNTLFHGDIDPVTPELEEDYENVPHVADELGGVEGRKQRQKEESERKEIASFVRPEWREYDPVSLKRPPSSDIMKPPAIMVEPCSDDESAGQGGSYMIGRIDTSPMDFLSRAKELAARQKRDEERHQRVNDKKMSQPFISEFASAVLNIKQTAAQTLSAGTEASVNTLTTDAARALSSTGLSCLFKRWDEEGNEVDNFRAKITLTGNSFMLEEEEDVIGDSSNSSSSSKRRKNRKSSSPGLMMGSSQPLHIAYRNLVEFYGFSDVGGELPVRGLQKKSKSASREGSSFANDAASGEQSPLAAQEGERSEEGEAAAATSGNSPPARNTMQFHLAEFGGIMASGVQEDTTSSEEEDDEDEDEASLVGKSRNTAADDGDDNPAADLVPNLSSTIGILNAMKKKSYSKPRHKIVCSYRVGPNGASPHRYADETMTNQQQPVKDPVVDPLGLGTVICPPVLSDFTMDGSKINVVEIQFSSAIHRSVCGKLVRQRLPRRIDRPLMTSHIPLHRDLLLNAKKKDNARNMGMRQVEISCVDFRLYSRSAF